MSVDVRNLNTKQGEEVLEIASHCMPGPGPEAPLDRTRLTIGQQSSYLPKLLF